MGPKKGQQKNKSRCSVLLLIFEAFSSFIFNFKEFFVFKFLKKFVLSVYKIWSC
jgi:hypothetical protein